VIGYHSTDETDEGDAEGGREHDTMSTAWNARLKAAWRGEVSGADLSAMFAATARLATLQQALEDRRLAAEIDHVGHDWRAVLAVGQIAAPLWLADALVNLAQAFYDAETQSHPDRPSSVSPYTHDLVAALLAPVEDIIADVTAALADPGHLPALTAPLRVGPGGDIAEGAPPDPVLVPYARGLLAGAVRVHTSAATELMSVQAAIVRSPSPDWLAAGLRRLDGELQAAGARLDMDEARLTALVGTHSGDPAALAAIGRDLWLIVGIAITAGQMLSDPHLLPEAVAAPRHDVGAPSAPSTQPAPVVPLPAPLPPAMPPPAPVDHVVLPRIDAGAAPLRERRDAPSPASHPAAAPPSADLSLPSIGGDPSQPVAPDAAPPSKPRKDASQRPESPATEADDSPSVQFPDIG
jgi:hypothetical protein